MFLIDASEFCLYITAVALVAGIQLNMNELSVETLLSATELYIVEVEK